MTTIDLYDFNNLAIYGDTNASRRDRTRIAYSSVRDAISYQSLTDTDSYMAYRIPGPLPPGCNITVEAEVRHLNADLAEINLFGYPNDSYGGEFGTSNRNLLDRNQGPPTGDFVKITVNTLSTVALPFVVAGFGFRSATGQSEFRNLKIHITNADPSFVMPWLNPPSLYSHNGPRDFIEFWSPDILSGGSVTEQTTGVVMDSSDNTESARMRLARTNSDTSASENAIRVGGIETLGVEVFGNVTRGIPLLEIRFENDFGTEIETYHAHVVKAVGTTVSKFYFRVPEGARRAVPWIGFRSTINPDGVFSLNGIRFIGHGIRRETEAFRPPALFAGQIAASAIKVSGTFVLGGDNSAGVERPRNMLVDEISNLFAAITFRFDEELPSEPFVIAQVKDQSGAAQFYTAAVTSASRTSFNVAILRSTGTSETLSNLPDGFEVTVIGVYKV